MVMIALNEFFAYFPNFDFDDTKPFSQEFKRLARQRQWKKGSKTWRMRWSQCVNCEYDRLFGGQHLARLQNWQRLCEDLDLEGHFSSIRKCKEALSKVYVNICDLLECYSMKQKPKMFRNVYELANYTKQTQRFFSRDLAKQDKLLRTLLKRLVD